MRKILMFLVVIMFILTGCSLGNTPTSKVEDLLSKYQSCDDSIAISYYDLIGVSDVDDDLSDRYKEVISNQYKNLSYEIKDEKIDGDVAIVTVEIKVKDYGSVIKKYDRNNYEEVEYLNLVIDDLENVKDSVTYTIEFNLTKNDKGDWEVDDLTSEINNKLLGIY